MNNPQHPFQPNCQKNSNNSGSSRCLDCCVVLKTTHNLIRSELFKLIKESENEFVDPADLNVWLKKVYKVLNLKLED